jgi:hypothetical protein
VCNKNTNLKETHLLSNTPESVETLASEARLAEGRNCNNNNNNNNLYIYI